MNQVYLDSARLMTRVAPLVFVDDTFALKGGTAINLFVRDMPRLSVDLDLVFPDFFLLSTSKYLQPYWLTMRQANELGGHVRKREEIWRWQLGWSRTRLSSRSLPPCTRQMTWWVCHPVSTLIGWRQFGQRPRCRRQSVHVRPSNV
jgi:hypothetical protein